MGQIDDARDLAASLLQVAADDLRHRPLPEDQADYFWIEGRGGSALIVDEGGAVLYANSSIDPDVHLAAFREGRRTPPEQFDR